MGRRPFEEQEEQKGALFGKDSHFDQIFQMGWFNHLVFRSWGAVFEAFGICRFRIDQHNLKGPGYLARTV